MATNPARDARLELACQTLFEDFGRDFTIKQLVKKARVSNTSAVDFRKDFFRRMDERQKAARPQTKNDLRKLPAGDAVLSALRQIASHSQRFADRVLDVVNNLQSLSEDGLSEERQKPSEEATFTALQEGAAQLAERSQQTSGTHGAGTKLASAQVHGATAPSKDLTRKSIDQPLQFVDTTDAPLAEGPAADRTGPHPSQKASPDNSTQLSLDLTPLEVERVREKSGGNRSVAPEVPLISSVTGLSSGRRRPKRSAARKEPAATTVPAPKLTPSEKHDLVIDAAVQCLREARGPLTTSEIYSRLPVSVEGVSIQELYSKNYVKDILSSACPAKLYYEEFGQRFWANEDIRSDEKLQEPVSVGAAALREAALILRESKPLALSELHSSLPANLQHLISVNAMSIALKRMDGGAFGLVENYQGKWGLPGTFEKPSGTRFLRQPHKMLPDLKREAEKILESSLYSLTAADIRRGLSDELKWHYTEDKFARYLKRAGGRLAQTDDKRWHLEGAPLDRAGRKKEEKKGRSRKQALTKKAVDDAIDHLKATGACMSIGGLFEAIECPVDRDTFRKGLNQRRKSSPELERVGRSLYRFNPKRAG